MRRWDALVDKYITAYEARGICPATVENVSRELLKWGSWLKRRRPRPKLEDVDSELVIGYIRSRTAFKSKSTVSGVISRMRGMGNFLVEEGYWKSNPLRWIRGPKLNPQGRVTRRLGRRRMQALWRTAASSRGGFYSKLWLTLLAVLYGTGIRRGELVRLDVKDYNRHDGFLNVDGRKNGLEHRVPLPEVTGKFLEAWLIERHNRLEACNKLDETALFINNRGDRMSGASVSRAIRRLAERSGIGRITCYHFRHSCASDLLEAGVSLPEVKEVLGHRAIATTMCYTHVGDPHRRQAVENHPINDMLSINEENEDE